MNVSYDAKAKEVTVRFAYDPAKAYPLSKSGKTKLAASSNGFIGVPGTTVKVSMNATVPMEE